VVIVADVRAFPDGLAGRLSYPPVQGSLLEQ